jgi:putative thioredoxin
MAEPTLPASGDDKAAAVVVTTTTATFRDDVLTRSARMPVLVSFGSPASSASRQLDAALEKIAKQADGKFRLAKMDAQAQPDIAAQLGVQALPAVVAFQKGQPLDGFNGALSPAQIKGFVERLVGPIGGEADEFVAQGEEALAAGDAAGAGDLFLQALGFDPAEPRAIAGLARAQVALGDLDAAEATLARAGGREAAGPLAAARAALELAQQASKLGDFGDLEKRIAADPKDHQARFDLALGLNAAGKREEAADALIEIVRRDKNWNDQAARKQLLQLFESWGHMEPETVDARRKLSVLLYS